MTQKQFALLGMLAPVLFWTVYSILSALRPEYSFMTKAVSELGSWDAPYLWTWNFLGFMGTGALIMVYSWGLFKALNPQNSNRLPMIGLMLSGFFMIIAGVFPIDMENRNSLSSLLHTIGSFGSYIFFLIGAFTFPKLMRQSVYWKEAVMSILILTWLSIVFGAWAFVFPSMPGVGQRIVFGFYFLWIFYTAFKMYKQNQNGTT